MIKKTKSGKFQVVSKKTGRALSKPTTKKAAQKRLRQIEWYKRNKTK